MGVGIAAAIPIIIVPDDRAWPQEMELQYFSPTFSDYYNYDAESRNYTIKHEILIENYQSFLIEFYDLIGESCDIKEPPELTSYEAFQDFFDNRKRNMKEPFLYERSSMFSMLGGTCPEYWLFYSGSYKALLEEYSTLAHFERILPKAMKNPLANTVKFGIFG